MFVFSGAPTTGSLDSKLHQDTYDTSSKRYPAPFGLWQRGNDGNNEYAHLQKVRIVGASIVQHSARIVVVSIPSTLIPGRFFEGLIHRIEGALKLGSRFMFNKLSFDASHSNIPRNYDKGRNYGGLKSILVQANAEDSVYAGSNLHQNYAGILPEAETLTLHIQPPVCFNFNAETMPVSPGPNTPPISDSHLLPPRTRGRISTIPRRSPAASFALPDLTRLSRSVSV
ncbi:hypothetical protein R3P38DRAFT_3253778 [Favolaschia claudopus]|uniref:Uncharacterized protein n=1 Tax=Favolaschia claudopus TaxID=2862362 RepID=A0AAW0DYW9_9AGAR